MTATDFNPRVLVLPLVWMLQYLVVAPTVVCWRWTVAAIRFGLKTGFVGVTLVFIPIVGWVILAWLLFRRDDTVTDQPDTKSIWSPWLLEWATR